MRSVQDEASQLGRWARFVRGASALADRLSLSSGLEQLDRDVQKITNTDVVGAQDILYAINLNRQLGTIQAQAGIPAAEHFRVSPAFFSTTHHEVANVLMNVADRASPQAREEADMLGKLAKLKAAQDADGRFPGDGFARAVRGYAASADPERDMGFTLDVAQSAGHFNPYPERNGGHLYSDASGRPVRNFDVAMARSYHHTPVGHALTEAGLDWQPAPGRTHPHTPVELPPTVALPVSAAFRQFDHDLASARLEAPHLKVSDLEEGARYSPKSMQALVEHPKLNAAADALREGLHADGAIKVPLTPRPYTSAVERTLGTVHDIGRYSRQRLETAADRGREVPDALREGLDTLNGVLGDAVEVRRGEIALQIQRELRAEREASERETSERETDEPGLGYDR